MNEKSENINIAVLIACYNRKRKTLDFLDSLSKQHCFEKFHADIYLLDDGSTDGTANAVKEKYPLIDILPGTGSLFWAGGMRKVWEYAMTIKPYDFFLLLNDDVVLFDKAFENLIGRYKQFDKNGTVLIGSTLDPTTNQISYGGFLLRNTRHSKYYFVKPNDDQPIRCHLGNANIMLVDSIAVQKIGIFSDVYTHFLADFDYTLTAYKAGINVLLAPGYYGYCEYDHGNSWLPGSKPLKERINYLYSPKGLAYKEYLFYIKKNFSADYVSAFIKLWMKTLFPVVWDKFKREDSIR